MHGFLQRGCGRCGHLVDVEPELRTEASSTHREPGGEVPVLQVRRWSPRTVMLKPLDGSSVPREIAVRERDRSRSCTGHYDPTISFRFLDPEVEHDVFVARWVGHRGGVLR